MGKKYDGAYKKPTEWSAGFKAELATILDLQTATVTNTALNTKVQYATTLATLAEINAGKVIVPAVTGKKIKPLHISMVVTGAMDTSDGTGFLIQDDNGTPIVVQTVAKAAATNGAVLVDGTSNVTRGVGMYRELTASKNLQIIKNGDALTQGTNVLVNVMFVYV